MDFLLVALLMLWSLGACFLPVREKVLRVVIIVNALLVALAMLALAVPVLGSGVSVYALQGMMVVDGVRALLALPIAASWVAVIIAFALWWGVSFKKGTGDRALFALRSISLIGTFLGVLLVLFTESLLLVLGGLALTLFASAVGALFRGTDVTVKYVRTLVLGCGSALLVFAGGVGLLLVSGVKQTGKVLLTHADVVGASLGEASVAGFVGIVCVGFSVLWFLGVLPGVTWHRKGIACLPKGQRLVLRVLLPAAVFPHALALSAWGGEAGGIFMQRFFLVGSVYGAIALIMHLREKGDNGEGMGMLALSMIMAFLAFGPAGAIPALMVAVVAVLQVTALLLAQGGAGWKARTKAYASAIIAGVPVASPLFVPYGLGIGYGMQVMPGVATVAVFLLVCASYVLAVRVYRAWSEGEVTYADEWSARIAGVLLGVLTLYGAWFMYTDTLALVVQSIGA